jgi:uncharacterized glyoxalase superfamily protein PhnB
MSDLSREDDPFGVLHAPNESATPDPAFVARLRRRLVDVLAVAADGTALPTIELAPPASHSLVATGSDRSPDDTRTAMTDTTTRTRSAITPYLCVAGAAAAIDWYTSVFGAVETVRYDGDDGRVGHAELDIYGAHIHLADEYPEYGVRGPRSIGGTPVSLSLEVDDADDVYARAVAAGAEGERAPVDEAYGARSAIIIDPFGHRWFLQTIVAQPSAEEISAAMPGFTVTEKPAPRRGRAPVELGYFTVSTPDTARAAAFYGALFGWETEGGALGDGYQHVANTALPLGLTPGSPDEPAILYYRVDDIDAVAARVGELGGRVVERAMYDSGPCIECTDDQGRTFHLWQPAPGY